MKIGGPGGGCGKTDCDLPDAPELELEITFLSFLLHLSLCLVGLRRFFGPVLRDLSYGSPEKWFAPGSMAPIFNIPTP